MKYPGQVMLVFFAASVHKILSLNSQDLFLSKPLAATVFEFFKDIDPRREIFRCDANFVCQMILPMLTKYYGAPYLYTNKFTFNTNI